MTANVIDTHSGLRDIEYDTYLLIHRYYGGSYGYIQFQGSWEGAKKHALYCLAREHHIDGYVEEQDVLLRNGERYIVGTGYMTIEVVLRSSYATKCGESMQ